VQVPRERAVVGHGTVLIGFRPEKVHLVTGAEDAPGGCNLIGPGTVVDASFCGVSTEYLVEVPGLGRMSVFAQNLDAAARAEPGDEVRLAWAPRHTFALAGDEDGSAGEPVLDPPAAVKTAAVKPAAVKEAS
jgi:spermidine/putrescine transport system ATP-binding protein